MSFFRIKIRDNDSQHDNIELSLQNYPDILVFDSYWFLTNGEERSINEILIRNLINLKYSVENLELYETIYWPIDLSDQSTGFLVFKKLSVNNLFNAYYLTSITISGYNVSPFYKNDLQVPFKDYFSILAGTNIQLQQLIDNIDEVIDTLY